MTTTTTRNSFNDWQKAAYVAGLKRAGAKERDEEADLRFMEVVAAAGTSFAHPTRTIHLVQSGEVAGVKPGVDPTAAPPA